MAPKKIPGTFICEVNNFQSLSASFKLLSTCKIHFTPNAIVVHSLDVGNIAFTTLNYNCEVHSPLSITIDLNHMKSIKSDKAMFYLDGHNLLIHDDGITYKCPPISDPMIDKKDREPPEVTWEYIELNIASDYIKKILMIVNAKNKYDFTYTDGTLVVSDATDSDVEYTIPIKFEASGNFTTRIQGSYLSDILMTPKYFDHCVVSLGTDSPMRISYKNEWMNLSFFVAPMIDS